LVIGVSSGLERLSFAERPGFADPYPEGLAVGHISVTGDASGGGVTGTFLSDGGFLYRLELLQVVQGDGNDDTVSFLTSHRWASDRSPAAAAGDFSLNWGMARDGLGTFGVYRPNADVAAMLRRFPMGRTDNVALQQVVAIFHQTNRLNVTYDFNVVCSYWRKEALQRPGFMTAFYEAPVVPVVGPGIR